MNEEIDVNWLLLGITILGLTFILFPLVIIHW